MVDEATQSVVMQNLLLTAQSLQEAGESSAAQHSGREGKTPWSEERGKGEGSSAHGGCGAVERRQGALGRREGGRGWAGKGTPGEVPTCGNRCTRLPLPVE